MRLYLISLGKNIFSCVVIAFIIANFALAQNNTPKDVAICQGQFLAKINKILTDREIKELKKGLSADFIESLGDSQVYLFEIFLIGKKVALFGTA
jgi:hypothetical protein